jgi:hypothetical protein
MLQTTIPAQAVITADRFVLRPLRKSDTGLIAMYTADKRLAMGTRAIPHPLLLGRARVLEHGLCFRGCSRTCRGQPAPSAHAVRRGFPRQPRLRAGLEPLRFRISGRCGKLVGGAWRSGSDVDLFEKNALKARGGVLAKRLGAASLRQALNKTVSRSIAMPTPSESVSK